MTLWSVLILLSSFRQLRHVILMGFSPSLIPVGGSLVQWIPHRFAFITYVYHAHIWSAITRMPILEALVIVTPVFRSLPIHPRLLDIKAMLMVMIVDRWALIVGLMEAAVRIPRWWINFCYVGLKPISLL